MPWIAAFWLAGCAGETGADAPPETPAAVDAPAEAAPAAEASSGRFVAWLGPSGALHGSHDGRSWERLGTTSEDLSQLTADAGGRLYAAGPAGPVGVMISDDGASWGRARTNARNRTAEELAICAESADELYALARDGSFYYSIDAGQSWLLRGQVSGDLVLPEEGFLARCATRQADHSVVLHATLIEEVEVLDEAGESSMVEQDIALFAVSTDMGSSWSIRSVPDDHYRPLGVGFDADGLWYVAGGGLYREAEEDWARTELEGVPDGPGAFTRSDTGLVGLVLPEGDAAGALVLVDDEVEVLPLPFAAEGNTRVAITWVPDETPGAMPRLAYYQPPLPRGTQPSGRKSSKARGMPGRSGAVSTNQRR